MASAVLTGKTSPTLAEICDASDDFLVRLDIAALNLICAVGLPGAEDLDVSRYLSILNLWTRRIQRITRKHLSQFRQHPHHYENSETYWRMLALTSILQKEFALRYNTARIDSEDWSDSRDILIHGLLGPSRTGTCSSLPVLVVAIGRRLGYPLYLVHTLGHLFVRWESVDKRERWNIEVSGNGMNHYSDEYYRHWPARWTPEIIALEAQRGEKCAFLRNLTNAEEFALGLCMRGHCLEAHGRWEEALDAYRAAARFGPNHPAHDVYAKDLTLKIRAADHLLAELSEAVPRFNPQLPLRGILHVNAGWVADGLAIAFAGFVPKEPPRDPSSTACFSCRAQDCQRPCRQASSIGWFQARRHTEHSLTRRN